MKRLAAVLLLVGFLVDSSASATQVLGTGNAQMTGGVSIANWPGFSFTTSSQATTLQLLDVGLNGGTSSINISLYAVNGSNYPTGSALASFITSSSTSTNYQNYTPPCCLTTINVGGTLGSYQLQANTTYAIVFTPVSGTDTVAQASNSVSPMTALNGSGWSAPGGGFSFYSINQGASWVTSTGSVPIVNLSIVGSPPPPSSVPTLSEWSQLLLTLMVMTVIGWHFHRERSY